MTIADIRTRNVCETWMPPKLKCYCVLDLWPRNPKFNRGHILVMTNHHTKIENPWALSSLVIDQTRFVYGPTDWPKGGRTCAKQYTPTSSEGGHNKVGTHSIQEEIQLLRETLFHSLRYFTDNIKIKLKKIISGMYIWYQI